MNIKQLERAQAYADSIEPPEYWDAAGGSSRQFSWLQEQRTFIKCARCGHWMNILNGRQDGKDLILSVVCECQEEGA